MIGKIVYFFFFKGRIHRLGLEGKLHSSVPAVFVLCYKFPAHVNK